jgi:hypothetical protein
MYKQPRLMSKCNCSSQSPLLSTKIWTRDLWFCSQDLRPLDQSGYNPCCTEKTTETKVVVKNFVRFSTLFTYGWWIVEKNYCRNMAGYRLTTRMDHLLIIFHLLYQFLEKKVVLPLISIYRLLDVSKIEKYFSFPSTGKTTQVTS